MTTYFLPLTPLIMISNHIVNSTIILAAATSCYAKSPSQSPVAPNIEISVPKGMEASIFAQEPMIKAPTQVEVDSKGRVWVMEGRNYRKNRDPKGDRLVILEDTNQDGKADKSSVFYQGHDINAAMGMTVIGNKVIISNAPFIFTLEDTDGDDKADKKTILFSGIGGKQHDHSVHTVVPGPDGKWYFNMGDHARGLKSHDGKPLRDIHGVDPFKLGQGKIFRCNPDGSELEIIGWNFRNPYELTLDPFGGIWQSDNDDGGSPACRMNYILEYGNYGYRGGPRSNGPRTGESQRPEVAHWHQNDAGIIPNLLLTGTGSPTGLCSYQGSLLPKRFHGQLLHCDHAQNIVRAYPVRRKGAGYKATMTNLMRGNVSWFRPTDVCTARDGSVFVSDWHDPASGGHRALSTDTGRIYRVAPKGHNYAATPLHIASDQDAVSALISSNKDDQYHARQWFAKQEADAIPVLSKLFSSKVERERALALWLLADIDSDWLNKALTDPSPDIRVTALRAARTIKAPLSPILTQLCQDPSPHVRRECAISLRHYTGKDAASIWATLASLHQAGDRWDTEALGIASVGREEACYQAYVGLVKDWNTASGHDIMWRLRTPSVLPHYVTIISEPSRPLAKSLRFFRSFDAFPKVDSALVQLLDIKHPESVEISAYALKHMQKPSLQNPVVNTAVQRVLAKRKGSASFITLLMRFKMKNHNPELLEIALRNSGRPLGAQALTALYSLGGGNLLEVAFDNSGRIGKENIISLIATGRHEASAKVLLKRICDPTIPDDLRISMVKGMNHTSVGARGLMPLIQKGKFPKHQENEAIEILASCPYANVVDWAVGMLVQRNGGREPLSINKLIVMEGNAEKGHETFQQNCLACHQVGEEGISFGPALTTVGNKLGRFGLYDAIINPDAGIEFNYETTIATLKDGTELSGFIIDENDQDLKLKLMGGMPYTVKKADIVKRHHSKKSMMPSVYGKSLSPQQLADLVAYLQTLK